MRMLYIEVSGCDFYNEDTNEFLHVKPQKLAMEHSLLSLSKWEANWKKPFLSDDEKTPEEYLDYIRCMTITPNVDPLTYRCLGRKNFQTIKAYIEDPRTATTIYSFDQKKVPKKKKIITSEQIYYWMIANNIPLECEKWHLNRLFMLIRICGIENNPKKKKMGRNAILRQNAELNAARRAKYHSKG